MDVRSSADRCNRRRRLHYCACISGSDRLDDRAGDVVIRNVLGGHNEETVYES